MSASERTLEQTGSEWGRLDAPMVLVFGVGLLLLRLEVRGGRAVGELWAIYLGLLAVSLWVGIPRERWAPLPPSTVLLLGVGAVVAATFATGRPLPVALSGSALALNAAAAIAEEAFFRRFLYGRLAPAGPVVAIAGSAFLFALVHVPAYGLAALWLDLAAGLVLSWQRWASGRWEVPAATHVAANLLAVLR